MSLEPECEKMTAVNLSPPADATPSKTLPYPFLCYFGHGDFPGRRTAEWFETPEAEAAYLAEFGSAAKADIALKCVRFHLKGIPSTPEMHSEYTKAMTEDKPGSVFADVSEAEADLAWLDTDEARAAVIAKLSSPQVVSLGLRILKIKVGGYDESQEEEITMLCDKYYDLVRPDFLNRPIQPF
jgi:hypothetical protein